MCPSGVYIRKPENNKRNSEKKNRYKIMAFSNKGTKDYWFYGVTKSYKSNYKYYYLWASKQNFPQNHHNLLFNKIKELNYEFDVHELELLPKDYNYKQAKLYLQEHYLNICTGLTNKMNYTFEKEYRADKRKLTDEIKERIFSLYSSGVNTREIAEMIGISKNVVVYTLRKNNKNKKSYFDKALFELQTGKLTLRDIRIKYDFSRYLMKKLMNSVK